MNITEEQLRRTFETNVMVIFMAQAALYRKIDSIVGHGRHCWYDRLKFW
jgi:NAD(P)-dependent dehydrogenase (short-subunit alcohol dehydrogenase family)